MSEVQLGMHMVLSESRDTVWSDSYLMETVTSTTPCPNSCTSHCVLTQREGVNILQLSGGYYIERLNMTDKDKAVNCPPCSTKSSFCNFSVLHHFSNLI